MSLNTLVGKTITRIRWNDDYLLFDTDGGPFGFWVDAECCSTSYFYDFYGVAHLLNNGPVISTRAIDLASHEADYADIQCYGFELVTNHPKWGEVTSVFSFRNSSNGYYGGSMNPCTAVPEDKLTDVVCDQVGG